MKYLFFLLLLVYSCEYPYPSGIIDPELQKYLEKFEYEANMRGVNVEVESLKTLMFKKLSPSQFGKSDASKDAYYVIIDSKKWEELNKHQREVLLFHEFGHFFLGLGHSKSSGIMMITGFRSWAVDYYRYNRSKALDKFFE